jgi:hypothetical protein
VRERQLEQQPSNNERAEVLRRREYAVRCAIHGIVDPAVQGAFTAGQVMSLHARGCAGDTYAEPTGRVGYE